MASVMLFADVELNGVGVALLDVGAVGKIENVAGASSPERTGGTIRGTATNCRGGIDAGRVTRELANENDAAAAAEAVAAVAAASAVASIAAFFGVAHLVAAAAVEGDGVGTAAAGLTDGGSVHH